MGACGSLNRPRVQRRPRVTTVSHPLSPTSSSSSSSRAKITSPLCAASPTILLLSPTVSSSASRHSPRYLSPVTSPTNANNNNNNNNSNGHDVDIFGLCRDDSHPARPWLLDRNPKTFAVLLDYLRTHELVVPPDVTPRAVYLEAEYFNLTEVIDVLRRNGVGTAPQFALASCATAADTGPVVTFTRDSLIRVISTVPSGARVRLQGVVLDGLDLSNLDLSGANLSRSSLKNTILMGTNLTGANLTECNMTGCVCVGATAEDAVLVRATLTRSNLSEANFNRADFTDSNLTYCVLNDARLNEAVLVRADLSHCTMQGVTLVKAKMWQVILRGVRREGTPLTMGGVLQ
eukprot:PhM_4_TR2461/c3_g2_i1/m.15291/K21919/KCTD9; BTB/POZ domain-containing protein KCTD9